MATQSIGWVIMATRHEAGRRGPQHDTGNMPSTSTDATSGDHATHSSARRRARRSCSLTPWQTRRIATTKYAVVSTAPTPATTMNVR